MSSTFTMDRKQASEAIGVSLRTLDRYIRSGRLKARKIGGFIRLDEHDVKSFRTGYVPREGTAEKKVDETIEVRSHRSLNEFDHVEDEYGDVKSSIGQILGDDVPGTKDPNSVYEILYKDTKDELKEYQRKLEVANYRVGHLEAELKNTVPLLEYKAASHKSEQRENKLKRIAKDYIAKAKAAKKELDIEKLNSKVYIVLLFGLLALQPVLWWLLQK